MSQSQRRTQNQSRPQWPSKPTLNPVRETISFDHATDTLFIKRTEDLQGHIDDIRREKNDLPNGMGNNSNWRKIGSIPLIIASQWWAEGFNCLDPNNAKEVRRRLNEFNKFRTVDKPV